MPEDVYNCLRIERRFFVFDISKTTIGFGRGLLHQQFQGTILLTVGLIYRGNKWNCLNMLGDLVPLTFFSVFHIIHLAKSGWNLQLSNTPISWLIIKWSNRPEMGSIFRLMASNELNWAPRLESSAGVKNLPKSPWNTRISAEKRKKMGQKKNRKKDRSHLGFQLWYSFKDTAPNGINCYSATPQENPSTLG